jgi:hypothetical protein
MEKGFPENGMKQQKCPANQNRDLGKGYGFLHLKIMISRSLRNNGDRQA